ncbi:MAG: hypothetical protein IMY67_01895 [Bacteroidetes bacterium]|nr:hypothetical protein [Bacteroidota bacterium]
MIKIKIYNGTTFVSLDCDTSKLRDSTVRNPGELFGRLKFSGSITVFNNSYDLVDTIIASEGTLANIELYLGGEIFLGTIDLEQNDNVDFRYKDLEIKVTDAYSEIDKYQNTEYNYLQVEEKAEAIFVYTGAGNYETIGMEASTLHVGFVFPVFESPSYTHYMSHLAGFEPTFDVPSVHASYGLTSATYVLENVINKVISAPSLTGDATIRHIFEWKREVSNGIYSGSTKIPPSGTGWVFIEDVQLGNLTIPKFGRPQTVTWLNEDYSNFENTRLTNVNCVSSFAEVEAVGHTYSFPRWRFLKDVIKYVFNQMDSRIMFDDTGTSTDSFNFCDTYTSVDWKYDAVGTIYPNTSYDTPFKWLAIMPMANAIPEQGGTQKSDAQRISYITWNSIVVMLYNMGFAYYIELRLGVPFFVLTHKVNVNNLLSPLNLSSFNSNNYTDLKLNTQIQSPEFNIILNKETARNFEFIGTDMIFPNLNIDSQKEYVSDKFEKDLFSIRTDGGDIYDDNGNKQNALLALQPYLTSASGSSAYIVRFPDGEISKKPALNAELAWSYISKHLLSELPSKNATVNGGEITIDNKRLKKRKSVNLDFLGKKVSDIDFEKNLNFRGVYAEVDEYSVLNNSLKLNLGELI